jgi:hypothetical protein
VKNLMKGMKEMEIKGMDVDTYYDPLRSVTSSDTINYRCVILSAFYLLLKKAEI